MIRKVSIIGAATLDGLCSVAAGEMGFIPVCIWQVWMRMGVVGKPFLLPQENPWEYYDRLVYSYNVPDFTSESVKLERGRWNGELSRGSAFR